MMRRFVFAVLVGLPLASYACAQAQNAYGPPPVPDPHPTHDPSVYVGGRWSYPPFDQVDSFYPAKARADKMEGQATIDCLVGADGRLTQCDVVAENPEGYGFGDATVAVFTQYAQVDPSSVPGGLKSWSRKKFTFGWTLD